MSYRQSAGACYSTPNIVNEERIPSAPGCHGNQSQWLKLSRDSELDADWSGGCYSVLVSGHCYLVILDKLLYSLRLRFKPPV